MRKNFKLLTELLDQKYLFCKCIMKIIKGANMKNIIEKCLLENKRS